MDMTATDAGAMSICSALKGQGFQAYLVGGVCRDLILGRKPKDWDIVTNAAPDAIKSIFSRSLGIGESYGIVNVLLGKEAYDVATYRSDGFSSDGRRPDEIKLVGSLDEDAMRRDFTMNAIYMDPIDGTINDPMSGRIDIDGRVIRFIGDPMERLNEDRLRALRAVRFAAQIGFDIEESSLDAIKKIAEDDPFRHSDEVKAVSWERIRDEVSKILTSKRPVLGIMLLKDTGLLHWIVPEYDQMWQCHQSKRYHQEGSAGVHSMCVLGHCCTERLEDRMACFLHDIGKPRSLLIKDTPDGGWKYMNYGHEFVGADMVYDILTRMKFPTAFVKEVVKLVSFHMAAHTVVEWSKVCKIRRFLGGKYFDSIMALALADEAGSMSKEPYKSLVDFVAKQREKFPVMLPDPFVTGDDLIAFGHKPGPEFKGILDLAYDRQLNGWDRDRVISKLPKPKVKEKKHD